MLTNTTQAIELLIVSEDVATSHSIPQWRSLTLIYVHVVLIDTYKTG